MNYYEVIFDNTHNIRPNMDDDETVSMCILGERKPTKEEAKHFCAADMKKMHVTDVVAVEEIIMRDAEYFFGMTEEDILSGKYPVFGGEPFGYRPADNRPRRIVRHWIRDAFRLFSKKGV